MLVGLSPSALRVKILGWRDPKWIRYSLLIKTLLSKLNVGQYQGVNRLIQLGVKKLCFHANEPRHLYLLLPNQPKLYKAWLLTTVQY